MNKKKLVIIIAAVVLICGGIAAGIAIHARRKANDQGGTIADQKDGTEQGDGENQSDQNSSGNDSSNNHSSGNDGNSGNSNTSDSTVIAHSSILNTGNLTEQGSGYEGTKGTGNYNYGEALQKSLLFYELQRSGDLPEEVRCNWRGDSGLQDGSDNGVDLTGGWYDAGDHVKFNLPMAYTGAMLGWSLYEDRAAYEESGQLPYMLGDLRWVSEYLIKCHTADYEFYYQVGSGGTDHSWWGPAEVMNMERPSYKVTKDSPGSAVTAEAAACLAVAGMAFEKEDPAFSKECLAHARTLYAFANETRSDAGYTQANGFYDSWSGYFDELAWAGAWLYLATGEESYLKTAEECYSQASQDYNWALCWDDVHIGAAVLLAQITDKNTYKDAVEKHLDYWTTGTSDGERITYSPKGLAWLDSWGSLRYATTTAYVAAVYSQWDGCPAGKKNTYWDFAVSQADYALGSTGFSYQIGYGDSYPVHPHHRTAQGSYSNNMNEPSDARHTLYGALVGGPDANDNYTDEVSNYNTNEVACDYNAGFTGLLAKLYGTYYGQTLKDFGAVETIPVNEFYVEGGVNADGSDFIEIKANVFNQSAWPARVAESVEMRYYVDLSELYSAGGTASDVEITTNYMAGGRCDGLKCWDEEKHIYYLSVMFDDGSLYPGGQEHYKKEVQIRMKSTLGVWDNSNDPSYVDIAGVGNGNTTPAEHFAVYENEVLVYGSEPGQGKNAGQSVSAGTGSNNNGNNGNNNDNSGSNNNQNNNDNGNDNGNSNNNENQGNGSGLKNDSVTGEGLTVSMRYDNTSASVNAIAGTLEITNTGDTAVNTKDLTIEYYLTKDDKELAFDCYHAAVTSQTGMYQALTGAKGAFSKEDAEDADTRLAITFSDNVKVESGSVMVVNFSIHSTDWQNMITSNDYSAKSVDHIVIRDGKDVIFGEEP